MPKSNTGTVSNMSTEQMLASTKMVVIDFDGIKRELRIPFRICASRETLTYIAKAVNAALARNWSYGWVDITECAKDSHADTKPIGWHDDGSSFGG